MHTNADIAARLDELGDLYELDGAVSYRVIAYRTAAKAVRDSSVSIMGLAREGKVTSVPGIGKTLEEKLRALDETGDIPSAVKLRAKFPAGLVEMTKLPGFGAKRARQLYDALGVDSLEALRAAAEQNKVRDVKGFGPKGEENLLKALAAHEEAGGAATRVVLSRALPIAEQIATALREHPASDQVEVAGSARRWGDSVKDIDIIATASDAGALVELLGSLELVESVQQSGPAGARVVTHSGMKVDLKVVAPDQFGNVLQHFTGSKAHNVQLREAMVRRGLHISEYGVLDDETGETTRCATEEEVYERLGLPWIPPELREGRGELDAALKGSLPDADHARRHARRPALPHDVSRTGATRSRRWSRRRRRAATSTSRSPTTPRRTGSATTSRPRPWRRGSTRSRARTSAWTASPCSRAPRTTSSRTGRWTTPTSCCSAWTG